MSCFSSIYSIFQYILCFLCFGFWSSFETSVCCREGWAGRWEQGARVNHSGSETLHCGFNFKSGAVNISLCLGVTCLCWLRVLLKFSIFPLENSFDLTSRENKQVGLLPLGKNTPTSLLRTAYNCVQAFSTNIPARRTNAPNNY